MLHHGGANNNMPTATIESPLLTRKEACAYLRLSVPTLRRLTNAGHIARVKIGHNVFYTREELDRVVREGVA